MRTKIYFLRGENRFVVYVGKTSKTLEYRLETHLRYAIKGEQTKKGYGIRAMLRRGLTPTITLQTEVEGNGNNAERAYIKWLRSYGIDLWNTTDGGDGVPNPSKEARLKMRNKQLGKHRSEETRERIRKTREERGHNRKENTSMYKRRHTPTSIAKMKVSQAGHVSGFKNHHHTEASRAKMRISQAARWIK